MMEFTKLNGVKFIKDTCSFPSAIVICDICRKQGSFMDGFYFIPKVFEPNNPGTKLCEFCYRIMYEG
jgi:hypothetical protein